MTRISAKEMRVFWFGYEDEYGIIGKCVFRIRLFHERQVNACLMRTYFQSLMRS